MNHQKIQQELSAYLDNELSPSRHKQIEAHLRSCGECSDMPVGVPNESSDDREHLTSSAINT